MTSTSSSFSFVSAAAKRTTKPPSSRRNHLEHATGNRRRNRRHASSSSSPLSEANDEKNEDENEERMSETIPTKTSRVVDFVAAWDLLSGRLSESSIMRSEDESDEIANAASPSREMLLAALALAIPKLQRMPSLVLDDFNRRHEFRKNRKEKDDELNGRCPRERAVAMCTQLIDLGMDAECCSAGLLRDASLANEISLETIEQQLGSGVVRVAHDCQRLRDLPERLRNNNNNASSANTTFNSNDTSSSSSSTNNNNNNNSNNQKMLLCDDEYAEKMRTFLLTFHDQRAIVVELASRLDILQHSREIFKSTVRLQQFALETMKVYAPLASALHCGQLSAELEDAAFRALFPKSYESLDKWLRQTEKDDARKLKRARQVLLEKMSKDAVLMRVLIKDDEVYEELLKTSAKMAKTTADSNRRSSDDKKKGDGGGENNNYPASLRVALNSALTVSARRKSRFSSMKKILRDGRDRAKLRDLLGVRVILNPQKGSIADIDLKSADMACYRAQQIAHAAFSAVKGRTKDYVAKPKKNGYQSLHSALIVSDDTDDTDDIEDDDPSAKNKNDSPSSSSSNDNNHNNNSHNNGSRTTIELQIRTRRMHASAEIGNAAHSSYKGGFTEGDPGAAKTLKDLVDAANIAAYEKFGDFTDDSLRYEGGNDTYNPDAEDALFRAFDVDKSGSVSVEELKQTIETIWLNDDDSDDVNDVYDEEGENTTTKTTTETAETLMKMLDVDADGKISPEEFKKFREFASTFKACSNADEKQSERIRKAVEVEMSSVDDDDEDDEDDDGDEEEEEIVVVDAVLESTVKIDDGKSMIEEGSGLASTSNSARRRIIRGQQQQQTQQKVKDNDEIDVDRLVKEVISASGSFDAISSSQDVSSDEKEEKEEILQQSSSTIIHDVTDDDDINEKNEKKDEEKNDETKEGAKAAQPSSSSPEKTLSPDQIISQSYVLISDSDASSRKAREALKDPLGGVVEWQLIWDLQRAGRAETARQLFYQRTTRTPSNVQLWEQWARFELLQGDQERSRGLYKTALLHSEGDAAVRGASLRKWATMEFGAKNFEESTSLFKRCVSVYDDEICGPSLGSSSSLSSSSCDYPPKGEIMKNLVEGRLVALHAWAKGEFRRGNVEEARRVLKLCADHVNETDTEPIARELCATENVEYSSEIFKDVKILRASPHVAHLYAQLDESEGQLKPALRKYRFASRIFPNDAYILQSFAEALARRGHVVNSRKTFKEAIEKFPQNHVLATSFAIAESKLFLSKGKETVARSEFARAASLAPWSVQVWSAWGQFEYAKSHVDAAKRLFERAVEAELGNSRALIGLAKCYDEMELFDKCRETLELAMLSNPDSWGVFHESAKLYEKRGNAAKASHLYNKAKALGMKSSVKKNNLLATTTTTSTSYNNKNKRGTWAPDERNKTEEQAQIAVDRIRARKYASGSGSGKRDPVVKFFDERSSSSAFSADGGSADDYYREAFPNAYEYDEEEDLVPAENDAFASSGSNRRYNNKKN
jgi:Tfp pilus assembly protein PilF/ppGpp synthetase/RelA/SpoT-type nucleotidyltranferase